jgi:dynein heavy chain 1
MKQTNELRTLLTDLNRGNVPPHWAKFKMPRGTSVGQYVTDLCARLAQLERIATEGAAVGGIWLGGLFQPEAYITATRQAAAHAQGWSLEQLVLSLKLEDKPQADAFGILGKFHSCLLVVPGFHPFRSFQWVCHVLARTQDTRWDDSF